MAMGKRPGGLTALAVLNFIFGGIGAIAALLAFGGLSLIREGIKQAEAQGLKYDGQSMTMAYVGIGLTALSAVLLIAAGVAYIKQKAAGRTLGTLYALVSIGGTVLSFATGGAIGVFGVVFLVYPLLTLVLVNTSFKNDLAN
jgi:hypothetical protein